MTFGMIGKIVDPLNIIFQAKTNLIVMDFFTRERSSKGLLFTLLLFFFLLFLLLG
jgi:hypothetical protein